MHALPPPPLVFHIAERPLTAFRSVHFQVTKRADPKWLVLTVAPPRADRTFQFIKRTSPVYDSPMDDPAATAAFAALGHTTRLAALRLIAGAPDGLLFGDVLRELCIGKGVLSSHLATLERAGLVTAERTGRNVRYTVAGRSVATLRRLLEGLHG